MTKNCLFTLTFLYINCFYILLLYLIDETQRNEIYKKKIINYF